MRWEGYVDADMVRKAIAVLQAPETVFEVRAIGTAKKDILSGYFRDAETLLTEFDHIDLRQRNVYITLGELKDECFSRAQSEHFLKSPQTTSDTEVIRYRWLFVDLDPVRTAGISSSDEELEAARILADKVLEYMAGLGFAEPIRAMSGNGYHLLYRIDIINNDQGQSLIEKCLKVLSAIFDNGKVKIDTTNSNPSRICKLHGTLAQKGRSTKQRPHRMSSILAVPDAVQITPTKILLRLAEELPEETKPPQKMTAPSAGKEFDLVDFMARNGLTYEIDSNDRATIYKLDACPFDPSHKDGDAKIFHYSNGAIAFKCHHNSCRRYKWQDVRLKFEPTAYDAKDDHEDDARIDAGYQEHLRQKELDLIRQEHEGKPAAPQKKKRTRKFRELKTAEALLSKDIPEPVVYVGVGDDLPLLVEGTCILSAKPKLGKSWLALALCIAAARGDDFLEYKTKQCSTLYLDLETSESLQQKRIRKMLKGDDPPKNFYLDTETDSLEDGFVDQIEYYLKKDPNIGIVVIDVFQIIRPPAKSQKETEYERAYKDITPLNELAQKHHISIILVCHDRKAVDPDDPFSNILGSTGLQGAATQMMVMFKSKKDDPIHISVKGKTIDGLPEMNVKLENAEWQIVEGGSSEEQEKAQMMAQYQASDIRSAVIKLVHVHGSWKGRCSELVQAALIEGVPVIESPKHIGGFLHRHQGLFAAEDGVQVLIQSNGTGPKIYTFRNLPLVTIGNNGELPLVGFEKADKYGPF